MKKTIKTENPKKNRVKKVTYKFKPKEVREAIVTEIALREDQVRQLSRQRQVANLVISGNSYEQIGDQLKISTLEAFNLAKDAIKRWAGELSHTANELKEIEAKRTEALLNIVMAKAVPHEIKDPVSGEPIRDINGNSILTSVDLDAVKVALQVMDRRAKLLGLDAADKLREKSVDLLTRKYIGVDPDAL